MISYLAMDLHVVFHALGNEKRIQVLQWLRDPILHFPPQQDGDLVTDGVCVLNIAEKLGVSSPTATIHLQVMANAGLLTATRTKRWTFYRRDQAAIAVLSRRIGTEL